MDLLEITNKSKIKVTGCIEWQGPVNKFGYGRTTFRNPRRYVLVHREVYRLTLGDFDTSFKVCHTCDNPRCINPMHLFLGTHDDNMKDMVKKNRQHKQIGYTNGNGRLNEVQVKEIKELYRDGNSISIIASQFAMSLSTISHIVKGRTWRHI